MYRISGFSLFGLVVGLKVFVSTPSGIVVMGLCVFWYSLATWCVMVMSWLALATVMLWSLVVMGWTSFSSVGRW